MKKDTTRHDFRSTKEMKTEDQGHCGENNTTKTGLKGDVQGPIRGGDTWAWRVQSFFPPWARCGAYDALSDSLVDWGGEYPLPIPYPLNAYAWRLDLDAFGVEARCLAHTSLCMTGTLEMSSVIRLRQNKLVDNRTRSSQKADRG